MKYIIANWKANQTYERTLKWSDTFLSLLNFPVADEITIVICPPFPFLIPLKEKLKEYSMIKLGVQDISQFPEGAHTGEVAASFMKELAEYVIIGHSERRNSLNESEDQIQKKLQQAHQNGLLPILCVRNHEDTIYPEAQLITYEPYNAISTSPAGSRVPLDQVLKFKEQLSLQPGQKFIYGGSVDKISCHEYLQSEHIDGVLVGQASLDPHDFYAIIEHSVRK